MWEPWQTRCCVAQARYAGPVPTKQRESKTTGAATGGTVAVVVLKIAFALFVVATPLLAAWISSSLAATSGGDVWIAAGVGVMLFPVLPAVWEAVGEWRFRRKKPLRERVLTRGDRLLLRTLALNLVFLVGILSLRPQAAVRAIETRGDWMLDGRDDETSNAIRGFLFSTAERFAWLYEATEENPYAEDSGGKTRPDAPIPMPRSESESAVDPDATDDAPTPTNPPLPAAEGIFARAPTIEKPWPTVSSPDPRAVDVPDEHEASIDALAKYALASETDAMLRFKLLHDWVAMHVDYDVPMLASGKLHSQDAASVFEKRKGVCSGYAWLLEALGKRANLDVRYVVGRARASGDDVDGEGHAWNIVVIDAKSYLVDATWNAGHVGRPPGETEERFTRAYSTDYLFTPPEIFSLRHFPDEPKFQLRDVPITRGEFFREPVLRPAFYAHGLRLVEPTRSQVTARGRLSLAVEYTSDDWLLASIIGKDGSRKRCDLVRGLRYEIDCVFDAPGTFEVVLFHSNVRYATHASVGEIAVVNDP